MPGERADSEYRRSAAVRGATATSPPSSVCIIDCPKDSSQ
jgi:hypothetical protein